MRWTDLPPDREPAEVGPSGLRRHEWEALRQRLGRLPPGHPSSPADESLDDGTWDDEAPGYQARGDEARGNGAQDDGGPEGRPGNTRRDGSAPRGGHAPAARPDRDSRHGDGLPGAGGREPYQPWFASGLSPEPWFAGDAPWFAAGKPPSEP
jgi:hypothetical protein